jgi:hypothetical protein
VDRYEVRDALLEAGVSPDAFWLQDVDEHVSVPTDFWFLRRSADGRWEVGPYERGVYEVRHVYDSEEAACAGLYTALTARPAPS